MSWLRRALMSKFLIKALYNIPLFQVNGITNSYYVIDDGTMPFKAGKYYRISYDYQFECTSFSSGTARMCIMNYGAFSYWTLGNIVSGTGIINGTVDSVYQAKADGAIRLNFRYFTAIMTVNVKVSNLKIQEVSG